MKHMARKKDAGFSVCGQKLESGMSAKKWSGVSCVDCKRLKRAEVKGSAQ